jgi:hypothetical protein
MLDLIEVFERADNGLLIPDTDYYMNRFVPKLAEMIDRYKIKWDRQTIVNSDDDLADRVFQAAVDLIAEAGAYCPDTNRVMEFSRDEILRAAEMRIPCLGFMWAAAFTPPMNRFISIRSRVLRVSVSLIR